MLAAGAFGTQQLLHAMAMEAKLPDLSCRLGQLTRTNSESLLGAVVGRGRPHPDFSRGVAITSSFSPEPGTHVEPVRYGPVSYTHLDVYKRQALRPGGERVVQ